jgi:fructokinase
MKLYGAVEAGGTKFVVAVGEDPVNLRDVERIPTLDDAAQTVRWAVDYFRARGPLHSIGIASFGPIDFATGCITNTPKLAWQNFPLRGAFEQALGVAVGFDTDVNGAALGEARCGAGAGLENFVYITVGTGIGGGAIVAGKPVHGLLHPEMGHLLVRRAPGELDGFAGSCPFHADCLEGMACGPAMEKRWGKPAHQLPKEHPAWELEADYLAQACFNLSCALSPQAILFGGGVMEQRQLFPLIRSRLESLSAGYLPAPRIEPPALQFPGLAGAIVLAMEA